MYPPAESGATCVPVWGERPPAPTAVPGTKRYVVVDAAGNLVFESDSRVLAFAALSSGAGAGLLDRNSPARIVAFVGTFPSPNGEPNGRDATPPTD